MEKQGKKESKETHFDEKDKETEKIKNAEKERKRERDEQKIPD